MGHLSLLVLGPFEAAVDGHIILHFESVKARALLAYLFVESHRSHARRILADTLWPSLAEQAALGNLRHTLANLRHVLDDRVTSEPFLQADHDCIRFNASSTHTSDVEVFTNLIEQRSNGPSLITSLERAISLFRGEFLEGMEFTGCSTFEEWVLLKREHLGWLLMSALHSLCDEYERIGHFDQAITHARHLVHREPWDELARQKLMRNLALAGHRGDALHQYADCKHQLMSELQVEPSYSTTLLYEQIRDGIFPGTSSATSEQQGQANRLSVTPQRTVQFVRGW
jgi:DNA-binding SARP family transcriptional activator